MEQRALETKKLPTKFYDEVHYKSHCLDKTITVRSLRFKHAIGLNTTT